MLNDSTPFRGGAREAAAEAAAAAADWDGWAAGSEGAADCIAKGRTPFLGGPRAAAAEAARAAACRDPEGRAERDG